MILKTLFSAQLAICFISASILCAHGEFVLDDFDDPFEIIMPDMDDQYVMQSDIGPLEADRWSSVVATSGSKPTGRVDSDVSMDSALTAEFGMVNPHPIGGPPAIGINLLYFIDEIDLTENGLNDCIAVDFAFLRSAIPLARVDVFVEDVSDPRGSYVSQLFDIPQQDEPFVLEFPFNSFSPRGGGAGEIDFRHVHEVTLSISPVRFTDIDNLGFSAGVDRLRVTRSIPEPSTAPLICIATVSFSYLRRMEKRSNGYSVQSLCNVGNVESCLLH